MVATVFANLLLCESPMSVTQCPTCYRTVSVPAHLRGQAVRCPNCQAEFSAPDSDEIDPKTEKTSSSQQFSDQRPQAPRSRAFEEDEFDDRAQRREDYRPEQLSGGIRAGAATVMLGLCAVLAIAAIGVGLQRLTLVDQAIANPNAPGLQPQLEDSDTWTTGLGLIQIGAILAAAVPFCMWMYKARANLKYLNVSKL